MATEIKVPSLGESVTEATVAKWLKKIGDQVAANEPLVELETDKVNVEVPASEGGLLLSIAAAEGETVHIGSILGKIGGGDTVSQKMSSGKAPLAAPIAVETPPQIAAAVSEVPKSSSPNSEPATNDKSLKLMPAVERLVAEHGLDPSKIPASGKDGRLIKEDILNYLDQIDGGVKAQQSASPSPAQSNAAISVENKQAQNLAVPQSLSANSAANSAANLGGEKRVKMTRLRQKIAERLKYAQNNAAMLTTFNEVDMTQIMALRSQYQGEFEKRHGVKLGFMSFFVQAAVAALQKQPIINAAIDGDEIVYKDYFDIGVAVSTDQGLMVPVLRRAENMSLAMIEKTIAEYSTKARNGKIALDDLAGGNFTITNGGVFGSLLSTPILNPPQSAILGMHKIQRRPMVMGKGADERIEIRPMMYLALSYDHRLVDGREAVTFLVAIKDVLEDPQRLLLEV
ncbi:MAG: 2-oxoglutarate dehydrogenase complex dihydrolipoyllysine-residue succinyltransferase [Alphaproteobacteria bacterium]|nr:2-oxoglutarate dehydrogenase complex dihydrolipoyllysine-residue succinyltransferase [Alphaproteobacteria bacterium]